MSTVKTIFKVLLGTVVTIVVSMSLIEVFNLSIYAIQVNKLCRTAAYQAAAMFTQETYNAEGRNFVGTLDDIEVEDAFGNRVTYCSSNFFYDKDCSYLNVKNLGAADADAKIYQAVFRNKNSEFYKFAQDCLGSSTGVISTDSSQFYAYTNLRLLAMGTCNDGKKFDVPKLTFSSTGLDVQKNQDLTQVNTYIENRYTPANLGIPFIDKNVATNMFQYSLTKLLSGCDEDNIWTATDSVLWNVSGTSSVRNEAGNVSTEDWDSVDGYNLPSVYYHGFKCYVSGSAEQGTTGAYSGMTGVEARISDIKYTTYDLTKSSKTDTSSNELPGRKEFEADTGYTVKDKDTSFSASKAPDIVSVSKSGTKGLSWSSSRRQMYVMNFDSGKSNHVYFNNENRDNALITVATIEYTVPMKYVGITPIAQVFNYIMGKSVVGIDSSGNGTEASGSTTYNYGAKENNLDFTEYGNLYSGENFTGDGELSAYYKTDTVQFMLID